MSATAQANVPPSIALQNTLEALTLSQTASSSISTPSSNQSVHSPSVQSLKDSNRIDPDALLGKYHLYFAKNFPFVIVPENIAFHELERQKPFLSKVVLMVGASAIGPGGMAILVDDILQQISARTIFQAEKNLDLLQGLILFLAWSVLYLA